MIELYGDGGLPCTLAPWSNLCDTLAGRDAITVCNNIISMGHVPFIGRWEFEGKMHEEPSFAINHGIAEAQIRELLGKFGQRAALRAAYTHTDILYR